LVKVVFLGGRQADILCRAYRWLYPAADVLWLDASQELSRPQEEVLASADVMALQARGAPLSVALDEIEAKGEQIWFPELSLDFLWPFGGQPHVYNTWDALFTEGPFPVELGDAFLNRRLQGRERLDVIERAYLALDVGATVDLDAYKNMVVERQGEIDKLCGSDFASLIESEFRARPLFVNSLVPSSELLRAVAEPLFARLPGGCALSEDWRPMGAAAPEAPIHPRVAVHFSLGWTSGRRYRSCTGEGIDFREYVRRYLAFAEGPELEHGLRLAAEGRNEEALFKLGSAVARPMGGRSASARRALALLKGSDSDAAAFDDANDDEIGARERARAVELLGLDRAEEAETETTAILARDPESSETWLLLAEIREKRGDAAGRVAALREGVARRPDDLALNGRLTLALAAMSDWRGAVESAEKEAALNPENAHARAFLAAVLERLGEPERAQKHLARALEIIAAGPQYAELRGELAKRQVDGETSAAGTAGVPPALS
jgi:tetratricopeptide (TPR) repeat protein